MSEVTIEQALGVARGHWDAGRLAEAEGIYRKILEKHPGETRALEGLAAMAAGAGKYELAVEMFGRAIALRPGDCELYANVGECYRRWGKLDLAIKFLRRGVELNGNYAAGHFNLGCALAGSGQMQEAMAAYRRAVELRKDFGEAWINLGGALRDSGELAAAIGAFREGVRCLPGSHAAHYGLALALEKHRDLAEAAGSFRRAVELNRDFAAGYYRLALVLHSLGRLDEAAWAFRETIRRQPKWADAHNCLGMVLQDQRLLDEAMQAHLQAIGCDANHAAAHNNLGLIYRYRGESEAAIAEYAQAMRLLPDNPGVRSNYVRELQFHPGYDAAAILREHREWNRRFAEPLARHILPHENDRTSERRLKIGYMAAEFCGHPVVCFLLPLLAHHDPKQVEIFGYSAVVHPDAMTERVKSLMHHWRDIVPLTDEQAATQIRRDKIDILVDLTLHCADNRLLVFARKPAPAQATWLGYAGTTGLSTMDYRLTDPFLDPPGEGDEFYSEKSLRLPHTFWCYQPQFATPEVNALPALERGYVTFCCFNSFVKVSGPALEAWVRILRAVPRSRLLIHADAGSHRERVWRQFEEAGIERSRVEFIGYVPTVDYFRQHQGVDMALDPFPFGGGTTSCDALWMGVPLITLRGATAVRRSGTSLMSNLDLKEWIADSTDEYVAIAVKMARELGRVAAVRAGLRERMRSSPVMNAGQFAAEMEGAYREMWRAWCAGGSRQ